MGLDLAFSLFGTVGFASALLYFIAMLKAKSDGVAGQE
jgi:hypothetical protein